MQHSRPRALGGLFLAVVIVGAAGTGLIDGSPGPREVSQREALGESPGPADGTSEADSDQPNRLQLVIGRDTTRDVAAGRIAVRTTESTLVEVSARRAVADLNRNRFVGRGRVLGTGRKRLRSEGGTIRIGSLPPGLVLLRGDARTQDGREDTHERVAIAGDRLPLEAAELASGIVNDDVYDFTTVIRDCHRRGPRVVDCRAVWLDESDLSCCVARYRAWWREDGRVKVRRFGIIGGRHKWKAPTDVIRLRLTLAG